MVTMRVRPRVSVLTVSMAWSPFPQGRACYSAEGKDYWLKAQWRTRPMNQISRSKSLGFSAERLARMDRFIDEKYVKTGRIPCAQILLARHGETIHEATLGHRDVERGVKLTDDTVYRI